MLSAAWYCVFIYKYTCLFIRHICTETRTHTHTWDDSWDVISMRIVYVYWCVFACCFACIERSKKEKKEKKEKKKKAGDRGRRCVKVSGILLQTPRRVCWHVITCSSVLAVAIAVAAWQVLQDKKHKKEHWHVVATDRTLSQSSPGVRVQGCQILPLLKSEADRYLLCKILQVPWNLDYMLISFRPDRSLADVPVRPQANDAPTFAACLRSRTFSVSLEQPCRRGSHINIINTLQSVTICYNHGEYIYIYMYV